MTVERDLGTMKYSIGQSVPRLDVPLKVDGRAVFGIDAGPPDAHVAMVARSPVFGGQVRSFDPSAALAVPGVDDRLGEAQKVVGRREATRVTRDAAHRRRVRIVHLAVTVAH